MPVRRVVSLRRFKLRSIVQSVGVAAIAGAVVVLASALFHFWWFPGTPCKDVGIYTIRADGTGHHRVRLDKRSADPLSVAWVEGGRRLAVTFNIYTLPYSPWRSMNADGSDVRPLPGLGPESRGPGTRLVVNTESGFGFVRHGKLRTVAFGVEPVRAGRPFFNDRVDWRVRVSPDGRFIAYSNGDLPTRIYLVSAESGISRQLTHGLSRHDLAATWSPDGRKLAFFREESDHSGAIYLMNRDGSDQRLIARNANEFAWSPDGRKLVIDAGQDKLRHDDRLYITDLRGNILRQLDAGSNGFGLAWAPGDKIAYIYDRGNSGQSKCGD